MSKYNLDYHNVLDDQIKSNNKMMDDLKTQMYEQLKEATDAHPELKKDLNALIEKAKKGNFDTDHIKKIIKKNNEHVANSRSNGK